MVLVLAAKCGRLLQAVVYRPGTARGGGERRVSGGGCSRGHLNSRAFRQQGNRCGKI